MTEVVIHKSGDFLKRIAKFAISTFKRMSIHIGAEPGQIAESIIISGDPLRIKYMAECYLKEVECFNEVRGMLGYTGIFKGKRVSMMGTGMGIPSTAIYLHELIAEYKVKRVVRAGTAGALLENIDLGDMILAIGASTDSGLNKSTFNGHDFAPIASYDLLEKAVAFSRKNDFPYRVGQVLSSDIFYSDDSSRLQPWIRHGVLGVEMETSVLYTLAARFGIEALSILSVSDNIVTGAVANAEERERDYRQMFEVALDII